jgi:hypothetical protein
MTRYLPSTAAATCLLVAALVASAAGGAVAGGMITGAQIKNGTITSKDVKDRTITTKDVKDGTLAVKDLAATTRASLRYELEYVVAESTQPVAPAATTTTNATCPDGTVVIGGDVVFEDPANGTLLDSGPMPGDDIGWFVDVQNTSGQPQLVTAQAHCANLG